ncbi:unnamed protein product [Sphenostylis stenocarpa]|uniref:Uncharacterized protein n=1 Tax=Sphenostylis stenocarpa TaxID=92480 RepID=A0AA86THI7_9FABA|nr:unnamed protein product [Sphenostylis stenocarpa]
MRWIGVKFDDNDFLVWDDLFGRVEEGVTIDVVRGRSVFIGEQCTGFGLERIEAGIKGGDEFGVSGNGL